MLIPKCKICHRANMYSFQDLLFNTCICSECFENFKVLLKEEKFLGYDILFLYKYEGKAKDYLFQYKGLYDYELNPIFTDLYKNYLRKKYAGYTFLCAPSSKEDDQKRKYNHLVEIAKNISNDVLSPFYKIDNWKQTKKSKKEREKIREHLGFKCSRKLDKVVLFDDVFTTGSTIKACLEQIKTIKEIKILIIFKNCK